MKNVARLTAAAAMAVASVSYADLSYTVKMTAIDASGRGKALGDIVVSPGQQGKGVAFSASLTGLPPGDHGFHVHQNPACGPAMKEGKMEAGEAAGPHYDPAASGKHAGPKGGGHKGDLAVLTADASGRASQRIVSDTLAWAELKGHSLVVHANGDTYGEPPANGGAGARIACGVIQ